MDSLQIIYPYYDNGQMLDLQMETWRNWSPDLKKRVKIILIDDGSPNKPAIVRVSDPGFPLEVYRIKENIPWNQNGAHNLGFHVAADGWCFTTDIDHVLVDSQLRAMLAVEPVLRRFFTVGRRLPGREDVPYKVHPNSWLLTRAMFWECGGYDEDYSGYYGSDSCFRRALKSIAKEIKLDPPYLVVYDENDIPDANTREFGRKNTKYHSMNYPHLRQKRKTVYKATNPLRFTWERQL